jgi:hypothetical protein
MIDEIQLTKTVIFVGDYFTLMTTVVLQEEMRQPGEDDHDFATRLASTWLQEHYGWDVAAVSTQIGLVDEDEEEE